ncbi:MAG: Prolipoprotein diacylglyceryl transferase [uncultured Thermomicrobiales bacterium]|uniref:Phosphatidylglycerol--prolipoprotein diacylglyceryl transferase n=1 Tax=uncultured Thermomicrobiales bacterium TaxID=1645740 RepID=A0A6J4UVG8_9BACT|nr:MAG: Prolipoprotein diacylglyceryl transferase [uncultured Thermomicrobiales bacterium]
MPTLGDPTAFALGPLEIRWYALFILAGIASAIFLSYRLASARGVDPEFLLDIAPWVVFLSIAGARLYYVGLEWTYFSDHLGEAINIRSGGLSIHGALLVGIPTVWALCRRNRQPFLAWADLIVVGLAVGQAIGRWGNWANQEAFGTPTNLPWAVTIDPARRPAGYEQFATFHPAFLYESIANGLNALALSWLVLRIPRSPRLKDGDVLGVYLIAYGIVRLLIERIRTDSLLIGPLPAAYWLSFALILAGGGLLIANRTFTREGAPAARDPV